MMRNLLTGFLAFLGLHSACGQQNFNSLDVAGFAERICSPDIVLLDVRSESEFNEGHLEGALNIDFSKDDCLDKAKSLLPVDKTIAVYCLRGRRSASSASKLADAGFKVLNLKGGITAWKKANMPVTTDNYEVDVFTTPGGKTVRFHALVHASIRIQYDGKEIQIDPVTKLGDRTIHYANMPKADYLFVTHEHGDHFDREAINMLSADNTMLVTNRRCADMLEYGTVMANGDKLTIADDFIVEAVPAYNTTEGHQQFHPKGRDNGFIITLDGLRIYVAGDTEDIPEMAGIKDIDIAFLPCNQPYTMTTDQLQKAARVIRPKVLFPYHYGRTDVSQLPQQLKADSIDVRIRHYE